MANNRMTRLDLIESAGVSFEEFSAYVGKLKDYIGENGIVDGNFDDPLVQRRELLLLFLAVRHVSDALLSAIADEDPKFAKELAA